MTSKADMGVSDLVITAGETNVGEQVNINNPTAVRVKMRISVTIFSEFAPGLCVPSGDN